MTGTDPAEALLAELTARAAARNRERARRLASLCADLGAETPPQAWQEARELAHQIAGSSGTFGEEGASALAREVLDALRERDAATAARRLGALLDVLGA